MGSHEKIKQKILIADDSAINRALLIDMLEDEYDVVEVENGAEAVAQLQEHSGEFALLLLDIVMPEMDGFQVLAYMNRYHWIDDIPVMMISAETAPTYIERAYDFGATDYISRPFDAAVVRRRVSNTMLISAKQRRLMDIVTEQIYEKEKSSRLMVSILSHIVEFRNGESGLHVIHINTITDLVLRRLVQKTDKYGLTQADINLISTASALHDIGKISISDEVLNKPGKLTAQEFEIMKTHAKIGAEMLANLPENQRSQPLVKLAYNICRWHHERYDGGGYPDGLRGDEIPIEAQVVALADVYDALTSERCYKKAYSHERAVEMILDGQCGAFNPLLLECLQDLAGQLKREIVKESPVTSDINSDSISQQLRSYNLTLGDTMLQQLEFERQQYYFLSTTMDEPVFRLSTSPWVLNLNEKGAAVLGLPETLVEPLKHPDFRKCMQNRELLQLIHRLRKCTPTERTFAMDLQLQVGERKRWYRFMVYTLWSSESGKPCAGLVGRLIDVDASYRQMEEDKREVVRQALDLNLTYQRPNGDRELTMTPAEVRVMIRYLQSIFDVVRLVDAAATYEVKVLEDGTVQEAPYHCYCVWDKNERCDNCISAKCLCCQGRLEKFEFVGEDIYYVLAMHVVVDGTPYALEMVSKVSEDAMLCGYGDNNLVDVIAEHNKMLYIDPVTEVYNRRYYEEQLKELQNMEAVAMIDVDNFKQINDAYGHHVGDMALHDIAVAIRSCVRRTDAVVRYGGDEFVVVFRNIPEDVFQRKIQEMHDKISQLRLEDYPELRFALSIGSVYGLGKTADLVVQADGKMYSEKRNKNNK